MHPHLHYSHRHWRFVYQSLCDLNAQLKKQDAEIAIYNQDMLSVFESLEKEFDIRAVFSHQEIGLKNTFEDRDSYFRN